VRCAFLGAAERHAEMLELVDRLGGLAAQIFDRILVTEPVAALDRVVHVPLPAIGTHVAEARGDAALRRDGVRPGREDLGDARDLEAGFGDPHRRAQPAAAGTDDDRVVGMVDDLIGFGHC